MNRTLVLLVTGGVWAAMMAALVRRELLPYFEYEALPTYRTMLRERRAPELERRAILLGAERAGTAEVLIEPMPDGRYRSRTKMNLTLKPGAGRGIPVAMRYEVNVDHEFQLTDFTLTLEVGGLFGPLSAKGRRAGGKLKIESDIFGATETDFPEDMTLSDGFMPVMGGVRLTVGKKWRLQSLDASGGRMTTVSAYATVERKESVRVNGELVPSHVVEIRRNASDTAPWHTLWVSEDGVVLVEQMSFEKMMYKVVLEEKKVLTPEQAGAWAWDVRGTPGGR